MHGYLVTANLHDESLEKSFAANAENHHVKKFLAPLSVGYGSLIRLGWNCFSNKNVMFSSETSSQSLQYVSKYYFCFF